MAYFDEAEKKQLEDEDREAWKAICAILLAIISIGVGIATLALLIIS